MHVELVDYTQNAFDNIVRAARGCYGHEEYEASYEDNLNLVRALIKHDHTPIEFGEAVFYISGISRACANQLNRYRMSSQAQKSMRYTDSSKEEFVHPLSCLKQTDACLDIVKTCVEFYKKLVNAGVPKEDARYYLPMGMTTKMHLKCNFRELRHILSQRLDEHAQWEVKEVAKLILDICKDKWPWLVEDFNQY